MLRTADIRLVIGTRPEAIKMSPVAQALAARGCKPMLLVTGQHPQLDLAAYGLNAFPALHLGCPGEENPHDHVGKVTAALLPLLAKGCDLLVVQGDTSSALGAALAGFVAGIPVAHVEAGLRTYDPLLPWPEEEFRTAIDARSDLLFAPTEIAAANLHAEQVPGEVVITGNTGIDALLAVEATLPPPQSRAGSNARVLVTCHRRESWGDGLGSIAAALVELGRTEAVEIDFILHPNPHVASRMRSLLEGQAGLSLSLPCEHRELVRRVRDAGLVLSDSGGIQEEAPSLGTPLLVLREKTERPEAIATGNARLVGTATDRIVTEVRQLLADPVARERMSVRNYPFGDGRSGPRIAAVIDQWIERHATDPARRVAN